MTITSPHFPWDRLASLCERPFFHNKAFLFGCIVQAWDREWPKAQSDFAVGKKGINSIPRKSPHRKSSKLESHLSLRVLAAKHLSYWGREIVQKVLMVDRFSPNFLRKNALRAIKYESTANFSPSSATFLCSSRIITRVVNSNAFHFFMALRMEARL